MTTSEKVNTVTVARVALLAAITAKAKANQTAYDKAVAEAEANNLGKAMEKAIEKTFDNVGTGQTSSGYYRTDANSYMTSFLKVIGQTKGSSIPKPKLFEQELAILTLATDDTLILPIGHNLLTVL